MPAADVVDQVGQGLRHRGAGPAAEQLLQVAGAAPGVEGPADRALADPEHRRAAGRLHVGDQRQLAGQVALERAGGDDGEVGLDEDVVQRVGEQVLDAAGGRAGVAAEQGAGVRREAAAAGDAEHLGLGQGELEHQVAEPAAPPRRPPDEHRERAGPGRGAAHRGLGEQVQHPAPVAGRRRPLEVGAERGEHPVAVVPAADQPGQPRQVEPGPGEGHPALAGRLGEPGVVRRRRHPVRVDAGGLVDQPGGPGQLDEQRGDRLGHVEVLGDPAQLAHAEAAGAQHRGRLGRPRLQQRLDPPDQVGGGQGARRGRPRRAPARRARGPAVAAATGPSGASPRSTSATSRGSSTVPASTGTSRARASSQRTGLSASAEVAGRIASRTWPRGGPGGERVEHLAGPVVGLPDHRAEPVAVAEQLHDPGEAGPHRQVERGSQRRQLAVGVPGEARGDRPAEPGRGAAGDLADRAGQPQRVVLAPGQGEGAQPVDAGAHRAAGKAVPASACASASVVGSSDRTRRVDEREHARVELLQRPQDRQPDARAGGQDAEVRRHRDGEVGAGAQQGGERLVGPGPQPVGQAARVVDHPAQRLVRGLTARRRAGLPAVRPGQAPGSGPAGERDARSARTRGAACASTPGLVPEEGVDEGSAAATGEDGRTRRSATACWAPRRRAVPRASRTRPGPTTWRARRHGPPATSRAPASSSPRARGERAGLASGP